VSGSLSSYANKVYEREQQSPNAEPRQVWPLDIPHDPSWDDGRPLDGGDGDEDEVLELKEHEVVVLIMVIDCVIMVVESGREAVHVAVDVNSVTLEDVSFALAARSGDPRGGRCSLHWEGGGVIVSLGDAVCDSRSGSNEKDLR
jgi:hypothetical protein